MIFLFYFLDLVKVAFLIVAAKIEKKKLFPDFFLVNLKLPGTL